MDHILLTLIPLDSVPMTSSANKESRPRKDSAFFLLKSKNPNTDFESSLYFLIHHSTSFILSHSLYFISFFLKPFCIINFGFNSNKKY